MNKHLKAIVLSGICLLTSCTGHQSYMEKPLCKEFPPINLYFMKPGSMVVAVENRENFASYNPDFISYPDDRTKLGLHGPVKRCLMQASTIRFHFHFNMDGNLTNQRLTLDSEGRYGSGHKMEYDASGKLKSLRRDANGRLWGTDEYIYTNGNLSRRQYEEQYRTYDWRQLDNGRFVPERVTTQGLWPFINMTYVEQNGNVVIDSMQYHNPWIPVLSSINASCKYEYDDTGRLLKVNVTYSDIRNYKSKLLYGICKYTYNEYGDVARMDYYLFDTDAANREAIYDETTTYSYEYDEQGNWVVRREKSNSRIPNLTPNYVRTIEYYTDYEIKQEELNQAEAAKKPFIGHWQYSAKDILEDESGEIINTILTSGNIVLNLYEDFVPDGYEDKVPGIIFSGKVPSLGMEQWGTHTIYNYKIKGNKVEIKFRGFNSKDEYSALLIYNPKDKSILLKDVNLLKSTNKEDYASDFEYFDLQPYEGSYQLNNRSTTMEEK